MDKQIIIGLLLIFLIFIIGCIYATYVRKIHEGFSNSNDKHSFWDHHALSDLWTNHVSLDGYDFKIDTNKQEIKSTGFDWNIQASDSVESSVNIESSGSVDIKGGNNVNITGGNFAINSDNNVSITGNSEDGVVALESGNSKIKVSPDEIRLDSKSVSLGALNNENIKLNPYPEVEGGPQIEATGKITAGNLQGNSLQINNTKLEQDSENLAFKNTNDDTKYRNLILGGLTGYKERENI